MDSVTALLEEMVLSFTFDHCYSENAPTDFIRGSFSVKRNIAVLARVLGEDFNVESISHYKQCRDGFCIIVLNTGVTIILWESGNFTIAGLSSYQSAAGLLKWIDEIAAAVGA